MKIQLASDLHLEFLRESAQQVRIRDALVGEAALVLESEYILDHAYVDALLRHRSRPLKGARLCPAVGSYATSAPTVDPAEPRSRSR